MATVNCNGFEIKEACWGKNGKAAYKVSHVPTGTGIVCGTVSLHKLIMLIGAKYEVALTELWTIMYNNDTESLTAWVLAYGN